MGHAVYNDTVNHRSHKSAEVAGWYGMSAILVAYALTSFGIIDSQGLWFQLLNLTGGLGLIIIAWAKGVMQSVILNVFWAVIAIVAIARLFL